MDSGADTGGPSPDEVDNDGDGYAESNGDCDDLDDAVNPSATEICDEVDNDCDGVVDVGTSCFDDDADGTSEEQGDCDDANPAVNAAEPEVCDDANTDEDCNGMADDDDPGASGQSPWCFDADHDGVGGAADCVAVCDQPDGYVVSSSDCDDDDALRWEAGPWGRYVGIAHRDGFEDWEMSCDLTAAGWTCDDHYEGNFDSAGTAESAAVVLGYLDGVVSGQVCGGQFTASLDYYASSGPLVQLYWTVLFEG